MSIDGFIAGVNGEMDWLTWNWDNELQDYVTAITEPVDCILLGRKLAQGFIPHWAAQPAGEDAKGVAKMNHTPKVVFTKTIQESPWANTALANGDLVDEVIKRKKQAGADIIAYGGGTFVSSLLQNKLVDELHLFINPVALGQGMPIFANLTEKQDFQLVASQAFSCGIVVVQYRLKE